MKTSILKTWLTKLKKTKTPLNTLIPLSFENVEWFWSNFKCRRCGHCCTRLSDIAVTSLEAKIIADHLGVSHRSVKDMAHCEHGMGHFPVPCPYYKESCSIYHIRPSICRSYPLLEPYEINQVKYLSISTSCKGAENICQKLIQQRLKSQHH